MPDSQVTLGELARAQTAMVQQLHEMREEFTNQHHRLRNDFAPLLRAVATVEERSMAQAREIEDVKEAIRDDIKPSIKEVRDDHRWLLRAIIGAYGAIALAIIGVLFGKVV